MKIILGVVFMVVAAVAVGSNSFGQPADLAKVLVGTWEGEVERAPIQMPTREGTLNVGRTLVVESLDTIEGRSKGKGRFGFTGGPMAPADIEVRTDGGKVVLDVRNMRGVTAELILSGESTLEGTLRDIGPIARKIRLTKSR